MAKILVADRLKSSTRWLADILGSVGHDVIQATGGAAAIKMAHSQRPSLVIVKADMPGTDGFEVLGTLKQDPATASIQVIIVSDSQRGESAALKAGASNYLIAPLAPKTLETAVKIALRDATAVAPGPGGADLSAFHEEPKAPGQTTALQTGIAQLDEVLRGGIPPGTLALLEGSPTSGKSILCQHIAYQSLQDRRRVAYITSEKTEADLTAGMGSIGKDVSRYVQAGSFHIRPMGDPKADDDLSQLMGSLLQEVEQLSSQSDIVIVDSITNIARNLEGNQVVSFFSSCEGLSRAGKTIIVVARSYAFNRATLTRLHTLCNVHLSLGEEAWGSKTVKSIQVLKSGNIERRTGNTVVFDVVPDVGIQVIPGGRIRI